MSDGKMIYFSQLVWSWGLTIFVKCVTLDIFIIKVGQVGNWLAYNSVPRPRKLEGLILVFSISPSVSKWIYCYLHCSLHMGQPLL